MFKIPLYGTTHVKVRAPFLSILMKNKCNLGRILDGLLGLLSRGQCQIKNKYTLPPKSLHTPISVYAIKLA